MNTVRESDALHVRVQAFIRAASDGTERCGDSYESLALAVARFQAAHVDGYGRLCKAHGSGEVAATFPAVPTDAFKRARVSAFAQVDTPVAFRTSGTTIGSRGTHWFRHTHSYNFGALECGARHLRLSSERFPILIVGPPPAELPDSSLTHMLSLFVQTWGSVLHDDAFFLRGGVLEIGRLADLAQSASTPVLVCGTSLAFVHLLDELGLLQIALPTGSRVMQTGGFKGRSRSVDAANLKDLLAQAFGINMTDVMSEYGMTELSTQFYEVATSDDGFPVYAEPRWARVVPVDPTTLNPVPAGEEGIARIEDLANIDSAWAIVVPDRVRRVSHGFELMGRVPSASPRGCSIAIDEILGGDL